MRIKKTTSHSLYTPILTTILTTFMMILLLKWFKFPASQSKVFFATCLLCVLIIAFDYFKKRAVTYIIIAFILAVGGILLVAYEVPVIEKIQALINWWIEYYSDEVVLSDKFAAATSLIVFTAITIAFYFLQKLFLARIFFGVLVLDLSILGGFWRYQASKFMIILALLYIFLILTEISIFFVYKKAKDVDRKKAVQYISPVILIIVIIASGIPSSNKPLNWGFFEQAFVNIQSFISEILVNSDGNKKGKAEEYSLSLVGFSDGGDIGGDVALSDELQLKVKPSATPNFGIYLTGAVSDSYDGRGWSRKTTQSESEFDEYVVDSSEFIYSVSRDFARSSYKMLSCPVSDAISQVNMKIEYCGINTKTLFYPLKTYKFLENNLLEFDGEMSTITIDNSKDSPPEYTLRYNEFDQNNSAFQEFLENQQAYIYHRHKGDYTEEQKEAFLKQIEFLPTDLWDFLENDLYYRAKEIRENYTGLPDDLPKRVTDLSQKITKNADTDYDKLKAIEKYLHTYTYTLTPGKIPEGEDAVDYFLFEKNEGYCTYFATAMAVMARCVDIPTRYVQGFAISKNDVEIDGYYDIKSKNAHAWVRADTRFSSFEGIRRHKSNIKPKQQRKPIQP